MPFSTQFYVYFVSGLFSPAVLRPAVAAAEVAFNAVHRRAGHRMHITVVLNVPGRRLDITLDSDVYISREMQLRVAQFFSKALSLQPGLTPYIKGRLLEQR